jgi:hypothetical protein
MLVRRTHILFDNELWDHLVSLSKREKKSVGDLVRSAVKRTYVDEGILLRDKRLKAAASIQKIRKGIKVKITSKDIRSFIEDGRKY